MRNLIGVVLGLMLMVMGTTRTAAQVRVGAKAGINLATASAEDDGESVEGLETRTGFHAGGIIEVRVSRVLAIQFGGIYSQKGASDSDVGVTTTFKFDYIDVPVLAKFSIPIQGAQISPHLFGGGLLSFEINCAVSAEGGGMSVSADCEDPLVDANTKSTDFALMLGGGVDIPLGGVALTLDFAYALGLVDIDEDDTDKAKNRVFSVSAGLMIPVGRR